MEGEGGYFRRNHLVPVPQASSWEELNDFLLEASRKDEQRIIAGRTQTVGVGMNLEREHLRTVAKEGFDLAAVHFPHVNTSGCVRALTNFYSVPLPVGRWSSSRIRFSVENLPDPPSLPLLRWEKGSACFPRPGASPRAW